MANNTIRLICVGRLRTAHWKTAAAHYMERIGHWSTVRETIIPDADAALPPPERNAAEGARILAACTPTDVVVCLDERGSSLSSRQFATLLTRLGENANHTPCFIIGGAFGLTDAVRERAAHLLALGPMTLPHELARVVLLEQLYRAHAIQRKLPYHHE